MKELANGGYIFVVNRVLKLVIESLLMSYLVTSPRPSVRFTIFTGSALKSRNIMEYVWTIYIIVKRQIWIVPRRFSSYNSATIEPMKKNPLNCLLNKWAWISSQLSSVTLKKELNRFEKPYIVEHFTTIFSFI